jgi:hypothetical protein
MQQNPNFLMRTENKKKVLIDMKKFSWWTKREKIKRATK